MDRWDQNNVVVSCELWLWWFMWYFLKVIKLRPNMFFTSRPLPHSSWPPWRGWKRAPPTTTSLPRSQRVRQPKEAPRGARQPEGGPRGDLDRLHDWREAYLKSKGLIFASWGFMLWLGMLIADRKWGKWSRISIVMRHLESGIGKMVTISNFCHKVIVTISI